MERSSSRLMIVLAVLLLIALGSQKLGGEARNVVNIPCKTVQDCFDPTKCVCGYLNLCMCHQEELTFGAQDLVPNTNHLGAQNDVPAA
ncbi:hypothetical protein TIFTF001_050962 [Ficus carica]|uniref:Uncharacterized protein n=1 Tax=Ficus carica TaxID=3494 RepID=A0AA87YPJ4_FICCA|nr:hypothetical protein TIFTF001_050956 [Ficus carica]GMN19743.1 hypothetical protein TIFTF001_050958 [Ficus carica]GMN19751.1 hypothetical protein TIFTF001_050960 [Ficus carica]GMN19773.1 hypothetical protein TIFTF001_050962 [Ficus carica]